MTAEQDRAAYRDTALKVLTVALSGVMGYLGTTAQGSPRCDYITVLWIAIIALAIVTIGAIDTRTRHATRQEVEARQHAEVLGRLDGIEEGNRRRAEEQDRKMALLIDAQQKVMRSALIRDAERYCRRGFVTPEEHRAYSETYGSYEHLGLNGYIKTYIDRVDALPIREIDEVIGSESTD